MRISLQKMEKSLKNKKGQGIMELAIGMTLLAGLFLFIFDAALAIQTKTETMMMARNGVRYMLISGLGTNAQNENVKKNVENSIHGLYNLNHLTAESQKSVKLSTITVINTKEPQPIKNSTTGSNPVYVEVCEVIHPISNVMVGDQQICSSYMGYHSSQYSEKRG